MQDPLSVEMYHSTPSNATFTMTVEDAGRFVWGGKNVLDASGGSEVTFTNGSNTIFAPNFTLGATPGKTYRIGSAKDAYARETDEAKNTNALTVELKTGASLAFDAARNPGAALFDFSGSTKGTFTTNNATLGMDVSRQLLSVAPGTAYLIAAGFSDTSNANLTPGDHITGFDASRSGQVWANSSGYASPYQRTINSWRNLSAAAPSLQRLLSERFLVSDENFAAIAGDLANATPDAVLNQASVAMGNAAFAANAALRMAFAEPKAAGRTLSAYQDHSQNAGGSLGDIVTASGGPLRWAPRVWGGYIGNFARADSHGGYHGYNADMHGFLMGVNVDAQDGRASVGAYGGYTRTDTDLKDARGEVTTDSVYAGLLGRVIPFAALPELALTLDTGLSWHDNESERPVRGGGTSEADFDQTMWITGLGLAFEQSLGEALLTPFVAARYTLLQQDKAREEGGLLATRTDGFTAHSFTTDLGLEAALDLALDSAFASGVVSPYARASWLHEYGDRQYTSRSRYAAPDGHYMLAPGDLPAFTVKSVKADADADVLGAGLRALFATSDGGQWGLNLGYTGAVSEHLTVHSINAVMEWRF